MSGFTNKVNISWIVFRSKVFLKADIASVSSSPGESLKHTISGLVHQTIHLVCTR